MGRDAVGGDRLGDVRRAPRGPRRRRRPARARAARARARRAARAARGGSGRAGRRPAPLRPAVARRLREGAPPAFPPARADALLLGGTVFDLLAREEGRRAAEALARGPHPDGPLRALEAAFTGRALRHTERAWRSHLARLG